MPNDDNTRDRVRALVRDVLANALPADDEATTTTTTNASTVSASPPGAANSASSSIPTRFINTLPPEPAPRAPEQEFTRDESSKMVITEDDVRGLEEGARLRVAEGVRLTPLAADIVRERRIELVRRVSRRGSRES